jgi:hypothetical protein
MAMLCALTHWTWGQVCLIYRILKFWQVPSILRLRKTFYSPALSRGASWLDLVRLRHQGPVERINKIINCFSSNRKLNWTRWLLSTTKQISLLSCEWTISKECKIMEESQLYQVWRLRASGKDLMVPRHLFKEVLSTLDLKANLNRALTWEKESYLSLNLSMKLKLHIGLLRAMLLRGHRIQTWSLCLGLPALVLTKVACI